MGGIPTATACASPAEVDPCVPNEAIHAWAIIGPGFAGQRLFFRNVRFTICWRPGISPPRVFPGAFHEDFGMAISSVLTLSLAVALAEPAVSAEPAGRPIAISVDTEETVYTYRPANNGAGPMWARGSTCLARIGESVFASGLETLEGVPSLNNCRWLLFQRETDGWRQVHADPNGRTREPCPLAAFAGGPLFLSANPTLVDDPAVAAGPARPEILAFDPLRPHRPWETLLPRWDGEPGAMVAVPLQSPLTSFYTATPRAGSPPLWTLDLLGTGAGSPTAVRYVRLTLTP